MITSYALINADSNESASRALQESWLGSRASRKAVRCSRIYRVTWTAMMVHWNVFVMIDGRHVSRGSPPISLQTLDPHLPFTGPGPLQPKPPSLPKPTLLTPHQSVHTPNHPQHPAKTPPNHPKIPFPPKKFFCFFFFVFAPSN